MMASVFLALETWVSNLVKPGGRFNRTLFVGRNFFERVGSGFKNADGAVGKE